MSEKDFKKVLIDLDLSLTEIATCVGLSVSGVRRYFRGELRNEDRQQQIKRFIQRRAKSVGVPVPEFWPKAA